MGEWSQADDDMSWWGWILGGVLVIGLLASWILFLHKVTFG